MSLISIQDSSSFRGARQADSPGAAARHSQSATVHTVFPIFDPAIFANKVSYE